MPTVSPAQHRLMEAAAHTSGGYGGVPQSVGKEFVSKDAELPAQNPDPVFDPEAKPRETDHEVAQRIRDGQYPSPTKYDDFWLFDLRITGTGAAWREALGEWAYRDPETWLSEEFLQRCNGLSVVFVHPDGRGLNTEEYRQRAIGQIVLPYIKGDEVWGIAKIFDADAAELMQTTFRSTSPGVIPPEGSKAIPLENGVQVLDEGLPRVLDHLAICQAGVWDKDGQPSGVRLDSIDKGDVVTDAEKEALEKERDDAKARADAAERDRDEHKARADALAKRKDETDEEALHAAEHEKLDAKRKDARRRHHDAKKHDGEFMDCAKCDAELEEVQKMDGEKEEHEKEREDKRKDRKDNAKEETVEAGRGTEEVAHALKDSKIAEMERQIAELQRANKPLTLAERDELARAYHRYDSLFQALMDTSPQPMPGETPIAFRKRAANLLRKYTTSFQNYAFHDSQQVKDFELVEKAIFDEATAHAKNPPAEAMVGVVREIKDSTTMPGKIITRFVGDPKEVWRPFTSPTQRFLKKVRIQPRGAAY